MALPRIDFDLDRDERLPAILLIIFFAVLCIVGGASREDVLAQSIIRGLAVALMAVQVLAGPLPDIPRYRALAWLLGSMIVLAAVQLVPLPPALWAALPGRNIIASSPIGTDVWRPINLVPDAGWNALFSLLAPLCVLVLVSALRRKTVRRARFVVLAAIIFSSIFALLQAAGSAPDNAMINGSTTDYAGTFANRNHEALFLAIGIALAWNWAFERGASLRDRRLLLSICIIALLGVSILVTGSRTGVILAALAVVAGPFVGLINRHTPDGRGRQRSLTWSALTWSAVSLAVVGAVVLTTLYFGRAQSLDRAANLKLDDDFRLRSLPTVWSIAKLYLPFGSGLGSFDAVFRIAEPLSLLEPTYFNHAHDDLLEIVIETGIFGPIILLAAMAWLARKATLAFSSGSEGAQTGRAATLIVVLVLIASISDYPARTPMIMSTIVIIGCWLNDVRRGTGQETGVGALPSSGQSL